jgi:hypothetical protein
MAPAKGRQSRRGVLLLVILATLAMFGVVGMTFVLITSQARRTAETNRRIDQQMDPPDQLLDQAMMQVARGSENWNSALASHSLLEDLYGHGYPNYPTQVLSTGAVQIVPGTGGQLFEFPRDAVGSEAFRYGGRVITFTSGDARGQSTRIVGWRDNGGTPYAQVLAVPGLVVGQSYDYLINGSPFSGTGFGFDLDGNPVSNAGGDEYALLPNPAAFEPNGLYTDLSGPGGANEDYDAVDYQNMLLALTVPPGTNNENPATSDNIGVCVPIPSLHRPALLRYWAQRVAGGVWNNVPNDLKRQISLRPLREFHFTDSNDNGQFDSGEQFFTGSNPDYNPTWDGRWVDGDSDGICDYRWDVDNDGDGVADSIWVDLGFPVRSTADGRQYKPLVAILCVDLDGRLNVNAHGNLAQADGDGDGSVDQYHYQAVAANSVENDPTGSAGYQFAGGAAASVPRGSGFGPAEVNLAPLFHDPSESPTADPTALSNYLLLLQSRYAQGTIYFPGFSSNSGTNVDDDPLSQNRLFDFWNAAWGASFNYWNFINNPTTGPFNAYGSPPDIDGDGALALDLSGHPLHYQMAELNEQIDDPYEIDLSDDAARGLTDNANTKDRPYSVAELERLLRPYDIDASRLPTRLLDPNEDGTAELSFELRHELTTESRHIPCPAFDVVKLIENRLNDAGIATVTADHLLPLVPFECMAGLPMNLNRYFGNGMDDDGDGIIDEPDEAANELAPLVGSGGGALASIAFQHANGTDVNGDGNVDAVDKALARQLYARHLYVLAMAVLDEDNVRPPTISTADWGALTPQEKDEARARWLAQWAVNVVDYRDRDAIMTYFEYDVYPFNDNDGDATNGTWDVDEDITSSSPDNGTNYRGLVWGVERPELLITETVAMHDRRTENLKTPGHKWYDPDHMPDPEPTDKDGDFDQRIKPQGSLFVELHNPWTLTAPLPSPGANPYGLYDTGGVNLKAKSQNGGSPVWRMLVVRGDDQDHDPDDPEATEHPADTQIERSIYFLKHSNSPSAPTEATLPNPAPGNADHVRHCPENAATLVDSVAPGRYTVIGPGDPDDSAAPYETYLGFPSRNYPVDSDPEPPEGDAGDRQIVLNPGDANPVQVLNNSDPAVDTQIQAPSAVVVNAVVDGTTTRAQRLSVTEPKDGYPDYDDTTSDPPRYTNRDAPLDSTSDLWDDYLSVDATHANFCVIHLQRLADPTRAYDADTNPYRTIDSSPVDLTTFNGCMDGQDREDNHQQITGSLGAPEDIKFSTCERGYAESLESSSLNSLLWPHEPVEDPGSATREPPDEDSEKGSQVSNLRQNLRHTFRYLNHDFGSPLGTPDVHKGEPSTTPFPWLTWNNGPFASPIELFQVPVARSSKLLDRPTSGSDALGWYGLVRVPADVDPYGSDTDDPEPPFAHLLNFFHSEDNTTAGEDAPKLHRLLDFVHVPSRFACASLQANPATFDDLNAHRFHVPFNRISHYRDPGRVNLNTVFSDRVWLGLTDYLQGYCTSPDWEFGELIDSRRGYTGTGSTDIDKLLEMDSSHTYPSRFVNPLRTSYGALLKPTAAEQTAVDAEVGGTLLRPDSSDDTPLFEYASTAAYNNTDRNPYFRYQGLQRLSSLVTSRSNVYAVWITVGYFEVEEPPGGYTPDELAEYYPDGYALGRELGMDTGEVTRHRAFYIYDRSIPVGFVRGQDLNVLDGVLTRRMIE